MRTRSALMMLVWLCLLCAVCFAQGQATLPDELRSKEPAKAPAQAKKAAPAKAKDAGGEAPAPANPAATAKKAPAAGAPILDGSKYTVKFEDTFSDNRNHWLVGDFREWKGEITGGGYVFEHKRKELGWVVSRLMGFDPQANYLIEVDYSVVSGSDRGNFGIIIGYERNGSILKFQRFAATFAGNYSYADRVWDFSASKPVSLADIISNTNAPSYRKGLNVKNTLKVIRYGEKMYLFVNDVQVADIKYNPPSGVNLGFFVGLDSVVKVQRIAYKTMGQ